MINRRAILIFTTLALLTMSSCLPQSQPEPAQHDSSTAAATQQLIVPSATAPPTATRLAVPSPTSTTLPATTPPATIMPQSVPVTSEPIEEIHLTMEPTIPGPTNPAIEGWITLAKEDLANRLGVSTNEIELVSFEAKVWPNPGLGCPKPGMQYKQVPVDGYLIRLRVGKQGYNYHGGGGRPPFLCEGTNLKESPSIPSPGFDT